MMSVHTHRFDNAHRVLRLIRKASLNRLYQIASTLESFVDKRSHQWPPSLQLQRTQALLQIVYHEQNSRGRKHIDERLRREAERVYCKLSLMDIADIAKTDC